MKGHEKKRECGKRVRDQGDGQEALAEDVTPPGCEAYEEEEKKKQLDSHAWPTHLSERTWSNDQERRRENNQASTSRTSIDVNFQVAHVHRPISSQRLHGDKL